MFDTSLFNFGLSKTTAGNASLASAIMPLAVALLNKLFKQNPLSKNVILGLIISFVGMMAIIFSSNKEISFANHHLIGTLVVVLGQFSNAYYTIYAKDLLNKYSPCQIVSFFNEYFGYCIFSIRNTRVTIYKF